MSLPVGKDHMDHENGEVEPTSMKPELRLGVDEDHNDSKGADLSHDMDQPEMPSRHQPIQLEVRIPISLSVPTTAIIDVFRKICTENEYMIIEEDAVEVTAVRETMEDWKTYFMKCLPWGQTSHKNIVALRLNVLTNTTRAMKTIMLKGLCGTKKQSEKFVEKFKNALSNLERSKNLPSPTNGTQTSFFRDMDESMAGTGRSGFGSAKYQHMKEVLTIREEEEEGSQMKSNLESYSVYHFNKILASDAYTLGKKVSDFVSNFILTYQNTEEAVQCLPQPIESVITMTNETVETLFAEFNYGRSETRKIMPFCRFAVEKFIFDKLYHQIIGIYNFKNQELTARFEDSRRRLSEHTLKEIFVSLDGKEKFWLISNEELLDKPLKDLHEAEVPYAHAIKELDKMEKLWNPREKLNCMLMMQSLMRSSVVDHFHGKVELTSTEDELPLIIYTVLKSRHLNLPSDLDLVQDYLKCEPDSDYEMRLITNIRVSIQYISDEWKIESNSPPS